MAFDVTGAELCRIIAENGLENSIIQSESGSIFTVDEENKSVIEINLYTQDSRVWPGVDKWPDDFDKLSYEEQDSIVDDFEVSTLRESEEPFERVQTIPLSMLLCFAQD